MSKAEKVRDSKPKKELASLQKDIKTCEEEIERLNELMSIKQ